MQSLGDHRFRAAALSGRARKTLLKMIVDCIFTRRLHFTRIVFCMFEDSWAQNALAHEMRLKINAHATDILHL